MVWDKLDLNTTQKNILAQEQKKESAEKQEIPPTVVPIVEENTQQTTDVEKPVEGYYMEKTNQEPQKTNINDNGNSDDDIDTSVNPDARITILPSIAINNTTNEITNLMEQAVNRAGAQIFEQSSNDSFYKAQDMVNNNQVHQCFNELNYPKRFNIYGKVVYEATNLKYLNKDPETETKKSNNSEKVDLGINWKSKSERTKAFVFGSYTHTKSDLLFNDLSGTNHENSYSVYGAMEHRFKKGDLILGKASYINDASTSSKMTNIDAGYYLKKFMVLAEGKTTIYKMLDFKTVTKTDFSISLNPELAFDLPQEKKPSETETENGTETESESNQQKENTSKPNEKKWSTAFSPFFDTQSMTVTGNTEEGVGLKVRFNRTDDDSNLRLASFGKISTTQQQDGSVYHVTFGSGLKYAKRIGSESLLKAEAEIKDKFTFGHENIMTASAHVVYTSPKISAEAEAKRILISKEQPSYAAVVGRVYYTPNKNVNLYTEASYTDYKDTSGELKGANVQAGVIVNF